MALEVQILGEDNHLFTLQIDSILLRPHVGDIVLCGNCGKLTKVVTVGTPGRIQEDKPVINRKQNKLFKE